MVTFKKWVYLLTKLILPSNHLFFMASFKTDESFLEKIAIGAIGTRQVFRVLRELGHTPIELERGSMNYKIWKK